MTKDAREEAYNRMVNQAVDLEADAVEIKMKNGKTYRIGTDEPKELEIAINEEIHRQ